MGKPVILNLSGHEYGAEDPAPENASRRRFLANTARAAGAGFALSFLDACGGYSHPDFKNMGSIPAELMVTDQLGETRALGRVIDEAFKNAAYKREDGSRAERPAHGTREKDVYIVNFGFSACGDTCLTIGLNIAYLDQNSDLPIVMLQVWPGFDDPESSRQFARENYERAAGDKSRPYDPEHASWQIVGCPALAPTDGNDAAREQQKLDDTRNRFVWAMERVMSKLGLENNTTRANPNAYPEKGYTLLPGQEAGKGFHFTEAGHKHGEHVNVVLMVDRANNKILKLYNALEGKEALTRNIKRDAALYRAGRAIAALPQREAARA